MKKITVGITAHVDSGKTTLSEAMMLASGAIRKAGRVDHGDSCLDTDSIERERGITIFSHQAEINFKDTRITLLDTPGHVDFSCETERTIQVLDYAVLVISGTDGVQSHTSTLWKLLAKYRIPTFIFVNKMDLIGAGKEAVMNNLRKGLSPMCVDFSATDDTISENTAMCSEELMEKYLSGERITSADISREILNRRIFPCCFGAALKMQGISEFLSILDCYTAESEHSQEFSARIFKISYDEKGSRFTHMKIYGGALRLREELSYTGQSGEKVNGKVSSIRFYSGEKFRTADIAEAGDVCAAAGLPDTYAGQGLGSADDLRGVMLEPVMNYHVSLPDEVNINEALKDFRRLEDEDPQLHILWNEQLREIHIQLMGAVQLEVLRQTVLNRFGYSVEFEDGAVTYRETIRSAVEGVGHYEPLRHYAEVHLILEPLKRGSGLRFESVCREDDLDRNWKRLVLTHLEEKIHAGVLTGSPITDMKITLASGKAHIKHTEGGDFRQATYRAVRHGLRCAESVLLEPYYDYELEIPTKCVGRAISDLQHMCAEFGSPETNGEMSLITGSAPVSEMNGYMAEVIAYTRGRGRLICTVGGYRECHNPEKVIEKSGYDADSDIENSADSVFCSHGSGYIVKWNEVTEHMHLPSALTISDDEAEEPPASARRKAVSFAERAASDEELMEIFERTYGKLKTNPRKAFKKVIKEPDTSKQVKLPLYSGPDYLLVDGYNIIFAWDELKKIAAESLDAARGQLINMMCNYQGYAQCELILVFDAYKVKGNHRDIERYCNINVVYTKESETADTYIEKVTHKLSKNHRVRVATSDGLEQIIILGNGAMRISAEEFRKRVKAAEKEIREYLDSM